MSELCNAFTFWVQPKKPRLFIHMVSCRYTCRHIPFFTTRMLINTSDSMVNNQTFKLSIREGYLVRLCCRLASIFLPGFLCRQNRSISMDFWKYAAVICCGTMCGPFFVLFVLNGQKRRGRKRWRYGVWKAVISTPFEWRDLEASMEITQQSHTCMYTNIATSRQMQGDVSWFIQKGEASRILQGQVPLKQIKPCKIDINASWNLSLVLRMRSIYLSKTVSWGFLSTSERMKTQTSIVQLNWNEVRLNFLVQVSARLQLQSVLAPGFTLAVLSWMSMTSFRKIHSFFF